MINLETGYLRIVSQGEIDPLAFTLMGGTTKRGNDNKIGMFGSGLKYAISSLMRNGIDFVVFSGETKLDFTVKKTSFREDEFNVIYINGKETSLTTMMGGDDWDKPFAPLREIYSNALDEDDSSRIEWESGSMFGYAGFTTFYIQGTSAVKDFFIHKDEYFLQGNPNVLAANDFGSIYANKGTTLKVFRKGILSYDGKHHNSMWMYNSDHFKINESRVISNRWDMERYIAAIWKGCSNYQTLCEFMFHMHGGNHGSFEREMDFDFYMSTLSNGAVMRYSEAWHRYVMEHKFMAFEHMELYENEEKIGRLGLKFELLKDLLKQFPDMDVLGITSETANDNEFAAVVNDPPMALVDKVIDAYAILRKTDYVSRLENAPVEYVRFSKTNVLGRAHKGKIQLSIRLLDYDTSEVARIIIEETEHIKTDFEDETRQFQDHLFKLYYNQLIR
jgi:hypothetical protein